MQRIEPALQQAVHKGKGYHSYSQDAEIIDAVQVSDTRPNASPKDSFWRGCSSGRATMLIEDLLPVTK